MRKVWLAGFSGALGSRSPAPGPSPSPSSEGESPEGVSSGCEDSPPEGLSESPDSPAEGDSSVPEPVSSPPDVAGEEGALLEPVSYTHLTLPTICSV